MKMATEFSQINAWLKKLNLNINQLSRRIVEVEKDMHHTRFWIQDMNRAKTKIDELEKKADDLDICIDETAATIASLKETLKKFIKLPDEQSQADFDNEVDKA